MQDVRLFEEGLASCHVASYLAEVVSVQDPEGLSRVQVRLLSYDGVPDQDAPMWARVSVPFAGGDRGAFMVPDVGDEVLVTFVNGDPRLPIIPPSEAGETQIRDGLAGIEIDLPVAVG